VILLEAVACLLDALASGGPGALKPGFGTPVHHLAHFGFVERLAARGYTLPVQEGAPAASLFMNAMSSAGVLTG